MTFIEVAGIKVEYGHEIDQVWLPDCKVPVKIDGGKASDDWYFSIRHFAPKLVKELKRIVIHHSCGGWMMVSDDAVQSALVLRQISHDHHGCPWHRQPPYIPPLATPAAD